MFETHFATDFILFFFLTSLSMIECMERRDVAIFVVEMENKSRSAGREGARGEWKGEERTVGREKIHPSNKSEKEKQKEMHESRRKNKKRICAHNLTMRNSFICSCISSGSIPGTKVSPACCFQSCGYAA